MTDFQNATDNPWLTRPRALRAAKTFFWVSCITVLIWIYADLEKTEREEFHGRLVLRLGAGGELAFLGGADMVRQDVELTFLATGSRGGLDRCRREMAGRPDALSVDLSTYEPGEYQLQAAELLRRAEPVRNPGLMIESASPAVVGVRLDRTIRVPDVEVKYPDSAVEAAISPPRMGVTVAATSWKKLKDSAKPGELVLKTRPVPAGAQGEPNRPLRVEVVPFISGVPVAPDRAMVDVELKVSQATVEKKLTVPVRIVMPPAWAEDDTWQRFILKREDPLGWQKELTLRGPKTEIDKLRTEDVDAYVILREDDKTPTAAWLKRDVEVRLPRDSQVQVVGEKPWVQFRLDPRPAATTPP